jgi:biotin carboxylase
VVAAEDQGVQVAAAVGEALGLKQNSPEAAGRARRKDLFRACMREAGLPSPGFRVFGLDADPDEVAAALSDSPGFPCVLKPLALSASRGVIRADSRDDAPNVFRRVVQIVEDANEETPGATPPGVLAEAYIPGEEVALEAILRNGVLEPLALLDKPDPLEGPFFEETVLVTPSRHPTEVQREIVAAVERAVVALGLREGPVHAELRINEDGVWPLEVAPRTIGGLCARLFRYRSGYALEEVVLRHALDLDLPEAATGPSAAGVMMLPIPRAGVLRGVTGEEAARAVAGIEDVVISIHPGGEVVPLPEGHRYLGFLFAGSETPDDVVAALRDAHGRLEIEIDAAVSAGA